MDEVPKDARLYRTLTVVEAAYVHAVKVKVKELKDVLDNLPASREVSLAKTKADEAEMWAVRGITQ